MVKVSERKVQESFDWNKLGDKLNEFKDINLFKMFKKAINVMSESFSLVFNKKVRHDFKYRKLQKSLAEQGLRKGCIDVVIHDAYQTSRKY